MSSFNNLNIGQADGAHFGDVNQTTNVNDSTVGSISQSAQQQTTIENELQKLNAAVDELAKKLPPDQATQVKNDLATLTNEAKSPTPRRSMFDISAKGLLEAAKFVAEMASPIGSAIAAITTLLF
jgi:conjugal transfer/entry exclusion protein